MTKIPQHYLASAKASAGKLPTHTKKRRTKPAAPAAPVSGIQPQRPAKRRLQRVPVLGLKHPRANYRFPPFRKKVLTRPAEVPHLFER